MTPALANHEVLDVLHVDMDCFFAAVEVLDNPSLAGKPVIVGGIGPRGVVASCSYEARAYGVRSAMPIGQARRRCPPAVLVAGRHDRYGELSRQFHAVLGEFTPVIEPIAFDEAYLDVSGSHSLFGPSAEIAKAVRRRVRQALALDCSVGVGRSKLVAKLASRAAKPHADRAGTRPGAGVVVVAAADEAGFLLPRPVSDLSGVGPKTAERLVRFGVHTVADLAALDEAALTRLAGPAAGAQLHALAHGHDARPVVGERPLKSVGHEETFSVDSYDKGQLATEVLRLSDSVAGRLRAAGLAGRTVTLKVRFADFSTITRARSLPVPLLSAFEIASVSNELLAATDISAGVRLIGVTVSSLEPKDAPSGTQLSLLTAAADDFRTAQGDVDVVVDAIRSRFGHSAVGPAAVLGPQGLRVKKMGDSQWGPARPVSESGAE
ncbi:MAG: DNA polymerase IV [Acidimicrobiales bacterium]